MMRVHRSMRGGGRGTAGGGGWRLLSSALMRGDGSQKNRSSRLAWRGRLAALSVAIECSEALPVRTLVDLIYFPHVGQERSDIVFFSLSLSLSLDFDFDGKKFGDANYFHFFFWFDRLWLVDLSLVMGVSRGAKKS